MQAFILVGVVVVLVVVCILFQGRPRPEAYSQDELTQIRIDRERAKEEVLEEKAHQLKGRARIHRRNRLALSARKGAGRVLQSAQERWDARGRSIYGDAWDDPQDGNLPLRTLFNLPSEEIDLVREEAKRLLESGWPRSDISSLPYPPNHPPCCAGDGARSVLGSSVEIRSDGNNDHQIMTAPACRGPTDESSSTPSNTDAPFIDTRFVHQPTPTIVPPLDFARLSIDVHSPFVREVPRVPTAATAGAHGRHSPPDAISGAMLPTQTPGSTSRRKKRDMSAGPMPTTAIASDENTVDDQDRPDHSSSAPTSSIQDPGLIHPTPPRIPPPGANRDKEGVPPLGRESLSARLARFAAGGTTGRVVPTELV